MATRTKCIKYTGREAKPSGLHTQSDFLQTIKRDKLTQDMCKESKKTKKDLVLTSTDIYGKTIKFKVPKCPQKNDVNGWMKWSGAVKCTKKEEQVLLKKTKTPTRSMTYVVRKSI